MQEEVTNKTVAIEIQAVKLTGRLLKAAIAATLRQMKKAANNPEAHKGKQSVKKLVKQGAGVSNIEITNGNIKSFERVARKYGVDFALKKDSTVTPPKYLVFFKARDADALTAAFTEFTADTLKRQTSKQSILGQLNKFKDIVKNNPVIDRTRHKAKEAER